MIKYVEGPSKRYKNSAQNEKKIIRDRKLLNNNQSSQYAFQLASKNQRSNLSMTITVKRKIKKKTFYRLFLREEKKLRRFVTITSRQFLREISHKHNDVDE